MELKALVKTSLNNSTYHEVILIVMSTVIELYRHFYIRTVRINLLPFFDKHKFHKDNQMN